MLAVIGVPGLAEGDAAWIEEIRRAHDPQSDRVGPHVTFAFPQDPLDRDFFIGNLMALAASSAPLSFHFDRLERIEDPFTPKYKFLNVLGVATEDAAPLDAIYHALGGTLPYAPHLTLTRFGAVYSSKALERQFGKLAQPIAARIEALDLLEIENGAIRMVQSLPLAARQERHSRASGNPET